MRTSISKKLLAGALSVMMVLSLFAGVPANKAQAAASVKVTGKTAVYTGTTNTYKVVNLKKAQYVKVSVTGSAKKLVTVKKGGKKLATTKKVYGGKTITLKVANKKAAGKKYTLVIKAYKKGAKKPFKTIKKTVKVYAKTTSVTLDQTEATIKVGETVTLTATKKPAKNTKAIKWTSSDEAVATVVNGVVTAVAEGTATITAKSGAKSATATITVEKAEEVKPAADLTIKELVAKKVNVLEATFTGAIDTEDVTLKVTKGTLDVPATVTWNTEKTVATITTEAKMTNGTYTVTATSKTDENAKGTKDVEIVSQYVDQIVILNDVALLKAGDKKVAYAYYDVLDQYGESMRTSVSIEWSGSVKATAKKTTGQIALTRTDKEHTFGDQIFLTGVYTKTGKTVQKTLTVGTEQALNSVEMKGFVKKGTTEILTTLPADFKADTYYMLFRALDQNGCPLDAKNFKDEVTFISDNILVVKEIAGFTDNALTINGEEYNGVFVTPGIKVADGGEVTVTAIANKTGNKTTLNFVVGKDAVVASFKLSAPATTVADGDRWVEIPFEAKDAQGNAITNFRTLAKQETFNTITFNASEGLLYLCEENDGTAGLYWFDDDKYQEDDAWKYSQTTDGIDRPISLTVVVVGGDTDNEMMSVSDKRRPDAIAKVKVSEVYTEGAAFTMNMNKFKFYDQYGELIGRKEQWGIDNGFFAAAKAGTLSGLDFSGYKFAVRASYKGNGYVLTGTGSAIATDGRDFILSEDDTEFKTATNIKSSATGEGFKYDIVKKKTADRDWDSVSTAKYIDLTVVDITQVKGFEIAELDTLYVGADATFYGDGAIGDQNEFDADCDDPAHGLVDTGDYQAAVKVTGTYNGKEVEVPAAYLSIAGNKVAADGTLDPTTKRQVINTVVNGQYGLKASDLYDKTSAKGTSKLANDTLKATINNIYVATSADAAKGKKYKKLNAGNIEESAEITTETADEIKEAIDNANGDIQLAIEAIDAKTYETEKNAVTDAKNAINNASTGTKKKLADAKDALSEEQLAEANEIGKDLNVESADNAGDALVDAKTVKIKDGQEQDVAKAAYKAYLTAVVKNLKAEKALADAEKTLADAKKADAEKRETYVEAIEFNEKFNSEYGIPVYDTATRKITLSDQKPVATTIIYALDEYTFAPNLTVINHDSMIADMEYDFYLAKGYWYSPVVVDQYGVEFDGTIAYRVTNVAENKEGYAENNFKVSANDSAKMVIEGAEVGDTFDLVLSCGAASKTIKAKVGADGSANISNSYNSYLKELVPVLEKQRAAGLN